MAWMTDYLVFFFEPAVAVGSLVLLSLFLIPLRSQQSRLVLALNKAVKHAGESSWS